ncbi:hypothetical protein CBS9595_003933 [Malassezia furfur]|nr:hypothetical protein CBS9595_003933 [Malassezia furfur]
MSVPPRTLLREPLQSNGAQRRNAVVDSSTQPGKTGMLAKLRPVPTKDEDQNRAPADPAARAYPLPTRSARAHGEAAPLEKGIHANPFMQRARAEKSKAEPVHRVPTPKSGTRTGGTESNYASAKRMFSNPASSESSVMVRSKSSRKELELARMRASRQGLATLASKDAGARVPPLPAGGARVADNELQAYEYLCHCSEAQQWIERCIGESLGGDIANMGEEMRNGIALAKLAKSFEPSCVPRIFVHPRLQFRHTDNINYFFQFADKIRLPNCFRFELTDLYEKKNFPKVVYCLHALSHFMAHLGRSDKVDDLVGKLEFNPEQLDKTQKSLDAQGGTMPSFGGVGQALAQEMGVSGTQHAAPRKADGEWIKPSRAANAPAKPALRPTSPKPAAPAKPASAFPVALKPVGQRTTDAAPSAPPAPPAEEPRRKSAAARSLPEEARERALQLSRERERKRLEQEREWERQRRELQEERTRQREQREQRIQALGREREQQRAEQQREREREREAKRAEDERERLRERERREAEYRRERERTQKEHEAQRAQEALLARERERAERERARAERAERAERERLERLERAERERAEREARLARERAEEEQAARASLEQEQFERELAFELERKRQLEAHAAELAKARAETRAAEERLRALAEDAARREQAERERAMARLVPGLVAQCAGVLARKAHDARTAQLRRHASALVPLQAHARGALVRRAQREERARWASAHDVAALVALQAALRGELFRRAFFQQFEALDAAELGTVGFQAHARGALARRRIFAVLLGAERRTEVYVRMQACVRTVLAQQRLLQRVQALRSDMDAVAHFQAHARGALARRRHQAQQRALARVEVVRGVQQMQTSLRAALQRRKHHELRKEMRYVQPDVTRMQAAIRGALVRAEFRWWAQHLVQSEPVAVHLQALVRGTLARRAFRRAYGHYFAHMRDVITVQSVVRAHLQGAHYRALRTDHPPLSAVRAFAHLHDANHGEFAEEVAVEQLRTQIVARIQQNKATEAMVAELETKNAILIRNKMGIEEAAKERTERGLLGHATHRASVLAEARDPFSEHAQDRPTARRRELYQGLFYLLQTRPAYLAKLVVLTTASTTLPDADRAQFEQTVLLLFNYAQQPREEYWLLRLLQRALHEHLHGAPSLDAFVTCDAAFQKRVVHYSKGVRERAYLAQLLGPLVQHVASDAQLDLETDPSVLYRQNYAREHAATGAAPARAPDADFDTALNDAATRTLFIRHLQALRTCTEQFLGALRTTASAMPYGMRYVARELARALAVRFPDASHDAVLRAVGEVMYYRYIHPAVLAPESVLDACPVLDAVPRRNLAVISQMMLQLARGTPFGDDEVRLQPLNEYVLQAAPRFQRWMQELIDSCVDPELHFGVDEYTDAASVHKPLIYISPNEIYAVHQLLCNNLASLVEGTDDPLAQLLAELGPPPVAASAELEAARQAEVALELTPELAGMRDPDAEAKSLFVETKRLVLAVLKVQTAPDLLALFLAPVTEKDEAHWDALLAAPAAQPLADMHELSFAELKATALENLVRLEQMGRVRRSDAFQAMLDALALDIRTRHRRRHARRAEQQMLTTTLHKLHERDAFMRTQIAEYQRYADQTMKTMPRRGHTFTMPFTRQYFHRRSLKAAGVLPKFGSYKYTARRLMDKGILVAIDAPENMHVDQVTVTVSSDELGVFLLEAAVSHVPAGSSKVRIEELLEAQYNGHQTIAILDRALIFDVNQLVQWINKKFYA